jgi:phospholipid-binding lipoprotein MlaA
MTKTQVQWRPQRGSPLLVAQRNSGVALVPDCDRDSRLPGCAWRPVFSAFLAVTLIAGCAPGGTRPETTGEPSPAVHADNGSQAGRPAADPSGVEIEPTVVAGGPPDVDVDPDVVGFSEYNDPLIGFNRAVFHFNDYVYRYALIPAGKGYIRAVPQPVRTGIGNVFHNIKTPVYLLNHLFQGEPELAGRDLARFAVNSTIGVLGIFDAAESVFEIERQDTRTDDTLREYGAGYGFYLVIPFLGPSSARGGAGALFDYLMNPIPYLLDDPESTIVTSFDYFQRFAAEAERYETLREKAEDPYTFFRNLHLQGVLRDQAYAEPPGAPADE